MAKRSMTVREIEEQIERIWPDWPCRLCGERGKPCICLRWQGWFGKRWREVREDTDIVKIKKMIEEKEI